jgi:hypothetical protein
MKQTIAKKSAKAKTGTTRKAAAQNSSTKDWRAEARDRMRELILDADPQMVVEQKWRKPSNNMVGVPVFSHDGLVCTLETYKDYVKLTFAYGGSLPDPKGLFTAGFGGTRRAIDIREGEALNAAAFQGLVKAAVARNTAAKAR